jgi:hypothetical protein
MEANPDIQNRLLLQIKWISFTPITATSVEELLS